MNHGARPHRRRLSASEGGGVMFNTGRGHRRARIFDHRAQGGTAWARC
jgi:hypothetical protein